MLTLRAFEDHCDKGERSKEGNESEQCTLCSSWNTSQVHKKLAGRLPAITMTSTTTMKVAYNEKLKMTIKTISIPQGCNKWYSHKPWTSDVICKQSKRWCVWNNNVMMMHELVMGVFTRTTHSLHKMTCHYQAIFYSLGWLVCVCVSMRWLFPIMHRWITETMIQQDASYPAKSQYHYVSDAPDINCITPNKG